MERALITRDFTVQYVADNGSQPHARPLQRGHAVGGARGLDPAVGRWSSPATSRSSSTSSGGGSTTRWWAGRCSPCWWSASFFFLLLLGPANPFHTVRSAARASTAPAPTRCCRTTRSWRSTRRCSTSGYVGFTVPFAFAMAALATGRVGEGWLLETRRWTLFAWGFLTVGIVLGAWWSYEVLGWGGYWGWDPVENAVAAALAHRHRLPALGDGAGAPGDAPGLEPVARCAPPSASPSSARSSPAPACSSRCTPSPRATSACGCCRSSG